MPTFYDSATAEEIAAVAAPYATPNRVKIPDTCMIAEGTETGSVVTLPHMTARQTFYMLYEQYTQAGWQDDAEGTVIDNSGDDGDTDPNSPVYQDITILRHRSRGLMLRLTLSEYEI